ncbi:MAG: hypothetical protein ACK5UQ_10900 [Planctomycetota bacterium]
MALRTVYLRTAQPPESKDVDAWRTSLAAAGLAELLTPSPALLTVTGMPLAVGGTTSAFGDLLGAATLTSDAILQIADLDRSTNSEGQVYWDELGPGPYRVALSLAEWRDREDERCTGDVRLTSEDVSRPLVLNVGRRAELLAEAAGDGCRVRGGIGAPMHDWASGSGFDVTMLPGRSGGSAYESETEECVCRPTAAGRFEFDRVRPGLKRVRAKWQNGSDWRFAESEGRLDLGGCLDVGVMVPAAGPIVEVVVGVSAAPGEEPERALAALAKVGLSLRVASLADQRTGDALRVVIDDWVPVRPGDRLRLLGVVSGRLDLALAWLGGKEVAVDGGRFSLPSEQSLQIADRIAVQLEVEYSSLLHARIELLWPSGESVREVDVHMLRAGKLLESRDVSNGSMDALLPRHGLSILVESSRSSVGSDNGWCARMDDVRPPSDGSMWRVTVPMIQGVVLAGTSSDAFRRGLRTKQVLWLLDGVVPLRASLADDGSFRLAGLPPSTRLRGVRNTPDQWLPASGTVQVELR